MKNSSKFVLWGTILLIEFAQFNLIWALKYSRQFKFRSSVMQHMIFESLSKFLIRIIVRLFRFFINSEIKILNFSQQYFSKYMEIFYAKNSFVSKSYHETKNDYKINKIKSNISNKQLTPGEFFVVHYTMYENFC